MNFDLLKDRYLFKQFYSFCKNAKKFVILRHELSAISQRKTLESAVKDSGQKS